MNCEQANNLFSARIDGELTGEDRAALDAHLAGCETCRQALAEMEVTDASLLRAFSPGRDAAVDVANRVSQVLAQNAPLVRPARAARFAPAFNLARWVGFAAAAAAGFIAAILFVKPPPPNSRFPSVSGPPLQPVAHLTLATGAVFTCSAGEQTWRPIAPRDPINLGCAIRTADTSKCELQLPDGSCMRLNMGTEAKFTGDRTVQVRTGQLSSALPPNAPPILVSAGASNITACGIGADRGAEFDVTCRAPSAAAVTVQRGNARIAGNVPNTLIQSGQTFHAPFGSAPYRCTTLADQMPSAQWQDELLLLKPANDPEVAARIDQLMSRIASADPSADSPCPVERDLRSAGQAWCSPMVCYLRAPPRLIDPANRRTAARLLADLAPPAIVPDLIELLADEDGQVRSRAAAALQRLTGQTLGYSSDQCAARAESRRLRGVAGMVGAGGEEVMRCDDANVLWIEGHVATTRETGDACES